MVWLLACQLPRLLTRANEWILPANCCRPRRRHAGGLCAHAIDNQCAVLIANAASVGLYITGVFGECNGRAHGNYPEREACFKCSTVHSFLFLLCASIQDANDVTNRATPITQDQNRPFRSY